MAKVLTNFELLEIAALDTANGNAERLGDVVSLTPKAETRGWKHGFVSKKVLGLLKDFLFVFGIYIM